MGNIIKVGPRAPDTLRSCLGLGVGALVPGPGAPGGVLGGVGHENVKTAQCAARAREPRYVAYLIVEVVAIAAMRASACIAPPVPLHTT